MCSPQQGFDWWIERIRRACELYDIVRLDHFRGFEAYWAIPAEEKTAVNGEWVKAPGLALFRALEAALGPLPLVAEDLGLITPEVDALRLALGLPGMKVLQFGFSDKGAHIHLPHRFTPATVAYTGTHDNNTTLGWWQTAGQVERAPSRLTWGRWASSPVWPLIRAVEASVAQMAVVPAQDLLELGSEARMNTPAVPAGNWSWRAPESSWTPELAAKLAALVEVTDRDNDPLAARPIRCGLARKLPPRWFNTLWGSPVRTSWLCASVLRGGNPIPMSSFRRLALLLALGFAAVATALAQSSTSSSNPAAASTDTAQAPTQGQISVQARIRARRAQRRAAAIHEAFDHRYEVYTGMAYLRFTPGSTLERAHEYAWDTGVTRYFDERLGVTVDGRGYYGTAYVGSFTNVSGNEITNPAISEYAVLAGPVYRFYLQPKFSVSGRVMGGFIHGKFSGDMGTNYSGQSTLFGLWPDGNTFAASASIPVEYNLTPRVSVRVAPEYFLTGFGSTQQNSLGFTTGLAIRFGKQ
jgi:hypothetical protein